MTWHETSDVERWLTATSDLLCHEPGRHTIALTLAQHVRDGAAAGTRFLWWEASGRVTGAAVWQAPYPALVCVADDPALAALPERWSPTAVSGETERAAQAALLMAGGRAVRLVRAERLFRLSELRAPVVPGGARPAHAADLDLVRAWFRAFLLEAGLPEGGDLDAEVANRVAAGRVLLWEADGAVVSLAGHQPVAFGGVRVGPVYTPPAQRGRGYGAGVTAAVTQRALDLGAKEVVLMTDLTNPTANALYPRLGYVPVVDRAVLEISSG